MSEQKVIAGSMNSVEVLQFSHFSPRKSERYSSTHSGIYMVERGKLEIFHPDGSKSTLKSGDFILYHSIDIRHAYSIAEKNGFYAKALIIPSHVFYELREAHEIKEVAPSPYKESTPSAPLLVFTRADYPEISILQDTLLDLVNNNTSPKAQLHIAQALLTLMVETEPQLMQVISAASHLSAPQRVIRYIEKNIDRDLSLDTLSEYMSMSVATLKRRLAAEGMTFSHILKVKRVNHAATLLRISQKSITEIAYESGFKSAAHFSTAFKSVYEVTPKAFRNRAHESRKATALI